MDWKEFTLRFIAGNLPVATFFVLSGYLLATSFLIQTVRPVPTSYFLKKRVDRLVPPLILVFGLLLIIKSIANIFPNNFSLWSDYAFNWRFATLTPKSLLRGLFLVDVSTNPPLWTLRLEVVFIVLTIFMRKYFLIFGKLGLWVLFFFVLIFYSFSLPTFPWVDAVNSWFFAYLIGVLLAFFKSHISNLSLKLINILICFSLGIYCLTILGNSTYKLQNIVLGLFGGLMIIRCEIPIKELRFSHSLPKRLLLFLGNYSYSIFLVHFPILIFVISKLGYLEYYNWESGFIYIKLCYLFSSLMLISCSSLAIHHLAASWNRYFGIANK